MSVEWTKRPEDALSELTDAYARAIQRGLVALGLRYAPQIEAWMKKNAVWTDRTGNARQTLWSDVMEVGTQAVVIILSHGMDYGVFLELANAGTYAIITPALDHFAPRIWRDVQRMMS